MHTLYINLNSRKSLFKFRQLFLLNFFQLFSKITFWVNKHFIDSINKSLNQQIKKGTIIFYRNCKIKFNKKIDNIFLNNMMNHTTVTMQHILNEPSLDPNLCKRILQQIKSPLLQQSFAMTNDQSISNSFVHAPKRPNIPPPPQNYYQTRRPAIKNKYSTYSNGQSFYEDNFQNKTAKSFRQNKYVLGTVSNQFDTQIIQRRQNYGYENQSIVSPLDPNITLKNKQSSNLLNGFDFWSRLCGNVFNTQKQLQHEIHYDESKSKLQRKKIFTEKSCSILQNNKMKQYTQNQIQSILLLPQEKSHIQLKNQVQQKVKQKSITQVTRQLRKNNHKEIADFVQTVTKIVDFLKNAEFQRKFLLENMEMVYQLTSSINDSLYISLQDHKNYEQFFHRMNFSSVNDMMRKISKKKLIENSNSDIKQFNKKKNKVSESIQRMVENFVFIEKQIEAFLNSQDSISKLKKIHSILKQKLTFNNTENTLEQIQNLFKDVKLFKFANQAYFLEFIWQSFAEKILTQQQFINSFVRSHGLYKEDSSSDKIHGLEEQLSQMGFVKN